MVIDTYIGYWYIKWCVGFVILQSTTIAISYMRYGTICKFTYMNMIKFNNYHIILLNL